MLDEVNFTYKKLCSVCPDNVELTFIHNIAPGNDCGYGVIDLYQCPICKTVFAL